MKSEIVCSDIGHWEFFATSFSNFAKQFSAALCFCHVVLLQDALSSHAVVCFVCCGMKLCEFFVKGVLYFFLGAELPLGNPETRVYRG
jgi:hypothetical protein